jgi:adenylate kinase family enzyme
MIDGASFLSLLSNPLHEVIHNGIDYDELVLRELIAEHNPEPQAPATLIILIGPSGCGKSKVTAELIERYNLMNYLTIDPDNIREILMTNGVEMDQSNIAVMSGITTKYNERMANFSIENRYNIIFDTTGRNTSQVNWLINEANKNNYNIIFSVIYASRETCSLRVTGRNQHLLDTNSRRIQLPIPVAELIHDGFTKRTGTLYSYFIKKDFPNVNEILFYNNNGGGDPELLLHLISTRDGYDLLYIKDGGFNNFYILDLIPIRPYIKLSETGRGRKSRKQRKGRKGEKSRKGKRNSKYLRRLELMATLW